MPISSGTKLGPYEIVAPAGQGGMGEVYRARDTRLNRTVAIKVLPSSVSSDNRARERFDREAKTISSLNHPHICTLHDIGHQDGTDYLVMEYLEGETLEKRLERGPLPTNEVLRDGIQIADALDKAHRVGIIHRDLKPGNIMLTKSGAKVLDFGLAKATTAQPVISDTAMTLMTEGARPLTAEGAIVGTFQYMAPEQLEGKEADARTDIFAFGAVLYEMATGKRAFTGKTQASLIASILASEPQPITGVAPLTPPALELVVKTCLAKDPDDRFQSAHDLKLQLQWIAAPGSHASGQTPSSRENLRERLAWIAVATILGAALVVLAVRWWRTPAPAPRPVMRWTTTLPYAQSLLSGVRLSPDGSTLVYVGALSSGVPQLFVRPSDQLEVKPIGLAERSFLGHFFSPDGRWLAYYSPGKLKKIPVSGGAAITLCDAGSFYGGSWGEDDTLIVGGGVNRGLSRISAAGGGSLETLTTPDPKKGEIAHEWPEILPGSKAAVFSIKTGPNYDDARIAVVNLQTREQRVLLQGGGSAHYAPTGHLLYVRGGALFAVPFDPQQLELKGSPVPVLEGVRWQSTLGWADYSFSNSGDLVYVPSSGQIQENAMVWVDRKGNVETIPGPKRGYFNPSISPDGQQVAVSVGNETTGNFDIWIYDLDRHTLTPLTFGSFNYAPVWAPDGKHVTFRVRNASRGDAIFWASVDGSAAPQQLLATQVPATPGSWLPDGSALIFYQGVPTETEVWKMQLPAGGRSGANPKPEPLIQSHNPILPQVSPDGRWIAYVSYEIESGVPQVYVEALPSTGGRWQISTDRGSFPRWAHSGREIFYRNADKMMAAEVETKPIFRAGTPRMLFEGHFETSPPSTQPGIGYDVSPDGKRFLMIKSDQQQSQSGQIVVVQNWFDELRRKVPSGKN